MATETYTPDNLIAGDFPVETSTVTIVSGQNLTRGALLGKITASGKFTLSASGAGDGSEVPIAVLAEDTDASGGDVSNVPVYVSGDFNEGQVTFGTGHTADSVRWDLYGRGIYLKSAVSA